MIEIYKKNPHINIDLAQKHNFIIKNNLSDEYLALQIKYYLILEQFLIEKLDLVEVESLLKNNNYFKDNDINLSEKLRINSISLEYFFIRSTLNIEVLTEKEIKILKEEINMEKLKELVKGTLQEVVKVNYNYGNPIPEGRILYDGTASEYLKNTNSLILGFAHDKYNTEIKDELWEEYSINQTELLDKVFDKIRNNAPIAIGCNVEIIEYII